MDLGIDKQIAVQDAREQTLRTVVDHLLTKDRDYRDLFTTHDTFISPAVAAVSTDYPTWQDVAAAQADANNQFAISR